MEPEASWLGTGTCSLTTPPDTNLGYLPPSKHNGTFQKDHGRQYLPRGQQALEHPGPDAIYSRVCSLQIVHVTLPSCYFAFSGTQLQQPRAKQDSYVEGCAQRPERLLLVYTGNTSVITGSRETDSRQGG